MKKIIISILLILAILATFVACDDKGNNQNNGNGTDTEQTTPNPEVVKTTYDILNELATQPYSKVKLDIFTVTGDVELKASYTLTGSEVSYSVEQLNLLPSDGNIENVSPDYKVTLSGSATVENGKITKVDGEAVSIPSYDELKGSFKFKESNFKNIQIENGKITADVVSSSEFFGTNKTINNMKITVEYTDSALQKITITYNTINSAVTTVYEFEK